MNIEIANRLVRLRKEKNLSQEALANELGISRQAVSKWERAEASPDTDNLILLAKLYGMSLDDLLKTDQKEFESGNNQQASKEKTEEDKKQKKKESVHISLKHGIHVTGEDGEVLVCLWMIKNMIKKNGVKFVKKKAGITTMKIIQSFLLHYLQLLLISG